MRACACTCTYVPVGMTSLSLLPHYLSVSYLLSPHPQSALRPLDISA